MIKINLLKRREKKAGIKKEFIILCLSVGALLLFLGVFHWRVEKERQEMLNQIAETKKEIQRYKSLAAEVTKAKEAQKTLQEKLNIINSLRKGKEIPVRILDEISIDKPEKLHLELMKKEGPKLGIEGIALDDETIVQFMANLKKSKLFKNVDLVVSEQIEQHRIKLKKFILSCEIVPG